MSNSRPDRTRTHPTGQVPMLLAMTRSFQTGAHGNVTQLYSFNYHCQEFQPSLPCVDSSTTRLYVCPFSSLLQTFPQLEKTTKRYAGGLDCMDRLGICGEVAAREGDIPVGDSRRSIDSDRVWRATPAVSLEPGSTCVQMVAVVRSCRWPCLYSMFVLLSFGRVLPHVPYISTM